MSWQISCPDNVIQVLKKRNSSSKVTKATPKLVKVFSTGLFLTVSFFPYHEIAGLSVNSFEG